MNRALGWLFLISINLGNLPLYAAVTVVPNLSTAQLKELDRDYSMILIDLQRDPILLKKPDMKSQYETIRAHYGYYPVTPATRDRLEEVEASYVDFYFEVLYKDWYQPKTLDDRLRYIIRPPTDPMMARNPQAYALAVENTLIKVLPTQRLKKLSNLETWKLAINAGLSFYEISVAVPDDKIELRDWLINERESRLRALVHTSLKSDLSADDEIELLDSIDKTYLGSNSAERLWFEDEILQNLAGLIAKGLSPAQTLKAFSLIRQRLNLRPPALITSPEASAVSTLLTQHENWVQANGNAWQLRNAGNTPARNWATLLRSVAHAQIPMTPSERDRFVQALPSLQNDIEFKLAETGRWVPSPLGLLGKCIRMISHPRRWIRLQGML